MLLTTMDWVPNCTIEEHYGLVMGSTVQTKNILVDFRAYFRYVMGGEVVQYTSLLKMGCDEATARMIEQAAEVGANAIVGVRMSPASLASYGAAMIVYGSAVKVLNI